MHACACAGAEALPGKPKPLIVEVGVELDSTMTGCHRSGWEIGRKDVLERDATSVAIGDDGDAVVSALLQPWAAVRMVG